ncbi:MAG: fibronectin type III domain-containing protein [Candidatus Pacebacteria bacterium]|jgi:hypothetical protein|nr:fibronectin type III domain-containing protein [Candidatus Paceibacterota bacterium]
MKNNSILKKTLKVFRNSVLFLAILSISFSNIPFYTLTKLLDSYIAANNIVDKAWHLLQDNNVVDKFASYRHVVEKARIHEAHAAALQYVGAAEASGNSAAYNVSLTALTGGSGGAAQAGDLVVVATGFVSTANGNPGVGTAGYTEVADLYANDTRDANFSVNWKLMPATPDTLVNCLGSGSATNGAVCEVHVWRNTHKTTPLDVTSTTAVATNSAVPNSPIITPVTQGAIVLSLGLGTGAAVDTTVTQPTGYINKADISVDPGNASTVGIASKAWSGAGAEDAAAWTGWTTSTSDSWAAVALAIRPEPVTTISNFVTGEPGSSSVAPGASGLVDSFGLATNYGTDTVTGVTIPLSAGIGTYVNTVAIVNDGDTVTYCSAAPVADTATLTGCTIPVTSTNTQFKIKITPISHAAMPAPLGGDYPTTATISAFTSTNIHEGVDTGSSTLTIDNLSSGSVSGTSGTVGNGEVTLNWTNPGNADYHSVVILRRAGSAVTDSPVEGATYIVGNTIGTATVACVVLDPTATCLDSGLVNGTAYHYEIFTKDLRGNYDLGTVPTGSPFTPAIPLTLTSYTNDTEPVLSYALACTTCGARIGGGAGFKQTITISGAGFGADPGVGNRSDATNNIKIGAHQIADANVFSWSPTTIVIETDSSVVGDTDTDWGAEFGGASALVITAGGVGSTALNFYVFPQITTVTQPVGLGADQAREYSAGDTDGVITLNGTRFGSPQGTGSVTIIGQAATVASWTNTAIQVQVPTAINDATNSGSITMTQGTGTNSKSHTYGNQISILPRITGFTPSNASEGGAMTINGNHFCQAGCPAAFDASNFVTFTNNKTATVFTSWSATAIATAVPTNSVSGDVVITSNNLSSNLAFFTVNSLRPNAPTNLKQWRDAGLTQLIAVGGAASSTPIYLTMIVENTANSGGTLYPEIEYKPIGTAFTCVTPNVACVDAVSGPAAGAAPGPIDCGVVGNACAISITPTDGVYHWQARAHFDSGLGNYYGPWVSYDEVNPETSTDFQIDTTPPAITNVASSGVGTNSATITWNTSGEVSTSQVQYNTTGTFGACAGDCTTINLTLVNSHSVGLSNINSGTTYYYRVRSRDAAGNESISANSTFTTSSTLSPAKTTKFHIAGDTGVVTNGAPGSYGFSATTTEADISLKSAFIVLTGIYETASPLNSQIAVQYEAETVGNYVLPGAPSGTYRGLFKLVRRVNAVNTATPSTLTVTPDVNTTLYINSADLVMTYSYTP